MKEVIEIIRLTKQYKNFRAVDDVSLSVKKGEIYGFLGLNGAGKTTTIRMLLGMIRPTSGGCLLNGESVSANKPAIWGKVGYMVEAPFSYPELTVLENLEVIRKLRRLPAKRVSAVVDQLKLTPYAKTKVKNLSLGNAQRLGIAKAIIHQPEILILDEPTNGLDPAGIVEIREMLRSMAINQGTTIFISSHILTEIAKIAMKVAIIHQGKLIQEMDTSQFEQLRSKRLLVTAIDQEHARSVLMESGLHPITVNGNYLEISEKKAILHPEKIAELLVKRECPPTMLKVEEEELESYFLRVIEAKEDDDQ